MSPRSAQVDGLETESAKGKMVELLTAARSGESKVKRGELGSRGGWAMRVEAQSKPVGG